MLVYIQVVCVGTQVFKVDNAIQFGRAADFDLTVWIQPRLYVYIMYISHIVSRRPQTSYSFSTDNCMKLNTWTTATCNQT